LAIVSFFGQLLAIILYLEQSGAIISYYFIFWAIDINVGTLLLFLAQNCTGARNSNIQ
jgi:hypothetical protein